MLLPKPSFVGTAGGRAIHAASDGWEMTTKWTKLGSKATRALLWHAPPPPYILRKLSNWILFVDCPCFTASQVWYSISLLRDSAVSLAVWDRDAYYALGVGDYGNTFASLTTFCHRDTIKQMLVWFSPCNSWHMKFPSTLCWEKTFSSA